MADDSETLEVDGRSFALSNPGKHLFPDAGITKRDLCTYYQRIAPMMLPYLRGRAITMQRFPDGVGTDGFYQKQVPDYFPDWIATATLDKEDGGTITHVVVEDAASLVYLAGQACITLHVALAPADDADTPDRMVFDLDPSDADFARVREAAQRLREILEGDEGLMAFCKTTGSRGLHVEVPLTGTAGFDEVRAYARGIASKLADARSDDFTIEMRKADRGNRVFIDYLRNAYGQTTAAPYTVRARPGAPVATPVSWDEVGDASLTPQRYTLSNIFRRLSQIDDRWDGFREAARQIPNSA